MNNNVIPTPKSTLLRKFGKLLLLIGVLIIGLAIVFSNYNQGMAQPYPPPDNQPAQQATLPYPPPGAQPGTQPTMPYPAPVTPTSEGLTPAYPPPGEQPMSTQTPDDFPTVDPLSTLALVPLPMEFLTLEFPSGFGGEVTELPAGSQEAALDEERGNTNMQTVLLVLIGMLWMILGGWVYLIARYWLIF